MWSSFDEMRDLDFNSVLWVREGGNVCFDPLALSHHDQEHLDRVGGVDWIAVTNSDHIRDAVALQAFTGARIAGPAAEKHAFEAHYELTCDRWLADGDELVDGLIALELDGSKTPGELAFLLDATTLITGDLVRASSPGRLMLLPDAKLADKAKALRSVARLADISSIEHVLVGDGWCMFGQGRQALAQLAHSEVDPS